MAKKKTTKSKTTKSSRKKATKAKTTSAPSRSAAARKKRIVLSYDAPTAGEVEVTGSFCGWDDRVRLEKDDSGRWKTTLTLAPGNYEYRFLVDGEWRDDPACEERRPNQFGSENCVLQV